MVDTEPNLTIMGVMGKEKKMKLKFNLDGILKAKGLNRNQAANLTGISAQAMGTLARNPDRVRIDTIEKLCRGLGIKPEDLFVEEKE